MKLGHVDYRILYLAQEGRCFYCKRPLPLTSYNKRKQEGWTRDHFLPKSSGKKLTRNVVFSCYECNFGKANAMPSEEQRYDFMELLTKCMDMIEKGAAKATPTPVTRNVHKGKLPE